MANVNLVVNPLEVPTTNYPESERVLRLLSNNAEVYAIVELEDGELPYDLETELAYQYNRKFGRGSFAYRGYEDVTDLEED